MRFEYIPKTKDRAEEKFGLVEDFDGFYNFIDEYSIIGVNDSKIADTLSASYFLRVLRDGASARARVHSINPSESDESSTELYQYRQLFDHGDFWKLYDGSVIFTSMPYSKSEHDVISRFNDLVNTIYGLEPSFTERESLRIDFLEERYRYRPNGDFFIMMYYDSAEKQANPSLNDGEIINRAKGHPYREVSRYKRVYGAYARDKHVSECAKMRARGICQLCNRPAPFVDKYGKPYNGPIGLDRKSKSYREHDRIETAGRSICHGTKIKLQPGSQGSTGH